MPRLSTAAGQGCMGGGCRGGRVVVVGVGPQLAPADRLCCTLACLHPQTVGRFKRTTTSSSWLPPTPPRSTTAGARSVMRGPRARW